jgi:hypothetical protein
MYYYIMATEAVKMYLKFFAFIYFLSSFIHIWKRQQRNWFLSVLWRKLNYNHTTYFQNVSLTIWPVAFIFLRKGLFYPSQQQSPHRVCARLFGKFHFVKATPSTGNNKDTCRSVCRRGRMKQTFAFSKETVECLHLIFWPGSPRRVHCRTAKPEPNRRVTIDRDPLLSIYSVPYWCCHNIR